MNKATLIGHLRKVEQLAQASKFHRLMHHPLKYIYGLGYSKLIYPVFKSNLTTKTKLFISDEISIALPAALDLYLTGGKTHDSELRLAKLMINHLNNGNSFLDIGAHYGYFTLLAAVLVSKQGRVIACEPAPKSFYFLQENTKNDTQITALNTIVSNTNQSIKFFEFPNRFSEYNCTDIAQYKNQQWFISNPPKEHVIVSTTIDELTTNMTIQPNMIKIDVEGAELLVLSGGKAYLSNHSPTIIMEYVNKERNNQNHKDSAALLKQLGYQSCKITNEGQLEPLLDIDAYLKIEGLESDNIVFIKS